MMSPDELARDHPDHEGSVPRRPRLSPRARPFVLLAVVAVISVVVVVISLENDQIHKSQLADPLLEIGLQILGIVVLGALVTYATDQLQHAAAARQQLDGRVLEFLDAMVGVYNGVKQVRRSLQAETRGRQPGSFTIDRDTYTRQLTELSGHQMSFESLRDRAALLQSRVAGAATITAHVPPRTSPRASSSGTSSRATESDVVMKAGWRSDLVKVQDVTDSIQEQLRAVEHHLNVLLTEYEVNLYRVPSEGRLQLEDLESQRTSGPALPLFINDDFCFKCCVSRHIHAVRNCLELHLLRASS